MTVRLGEGSPRPTPVETEHSIQTRLTLAALGERAVRARKAEYQERLNRSDTGTRLELALGAKAVESEPSVSVAAEE